MTPAGGERENRHVSVRANGVRICAALEKGAQDLGVAGSGGVGRGIVRGHSGLDQVQRRAAALLDDAAEERGLGSLTEQFDLG